MFFSRVHELETGVEAQQFVTRNGRIRWPDATVRRHRFFGDEVLPNLVL
jgi:hypothetical protein